MRLLTTMEEVMKTVHRLCLVLVLAFGWVPVALADDNAANAVRQTIEGQLRAFLGGDDQAAYSYAAPNIRQMYPTPEGFMAMVRNGYAPVHRPRNYAFGKFHALAPGRVAQGVFVLGPDGKDYEALYVLELQDDGIYRIVSVSLRAANLPST
jgi:hypothetical protein